jgi:hypothetical protein
MYHPYFRGKQYDLIVIRETAVLLAQMNFVPIVEPVKEALKGLERTIEAICEAQRKAIVIVNPYHGDHGEDGVGISELLRNGCFRNDLIGAGILLKKDMTIQDVMACCNLHRNHQLTLIHAGFTQAKALANALDEALITTRDVFFETHCGKLYRKHFQGSDRILLRDGFQRRRNRDYPPVEPFSDLHVTYMEEGMNGFGDFLIVGDGYSEGGGPAYAVAIHLTFIDPEQDDAMFIYHFVSTRQDTPTDPAGKFAEALAKMIHKLDSGTSKILETTAVMEFRELHAKGHFPGLGYVKKLSMKHHIETLSAFLG